MDQKEQFRRVKQNGVESKHVHKYLSIFVYAYTKHVWSSI